MSRRARNRIALLLLAAVVAGCASGRSFRRGQEAARLGDWDTAVAYYRAALTDDPDRLDVRVALERATQSASLDHMSRARRFESEGEFAAAAAEYRRVIDLDAGNQLAAAKAVEMDKRLREQIDAARPRPEIEQLRNQIRLERETAALPLNQRLPKISFSGATLREVLEFIAGTTNVNIIIDPNMPPADLSRQVVLDLQESTVDEVLRHLSALYKLFYRTLDARTILVASDSVQSRQQYEEQSIQTFYISHAKAAEIGNILTMMLRGAGTAPTGSTPTIIAHEGANTLTVRATPGTMQIAERIIRTNDRPKAEVVVEVSILEVDRQRAKQHGLDLSQYAIGLTMSPEVAPPNVASTAGAFPVMPPPFNANTISRGISANDLYLTVPTAMVRFLESDANTRLIAKPNLRGQEGTELTLNLGDEIPVPTTTFGSVGGGGLATIPISQFEYRPVGVNMKLKPRVTYEGEIVLELTVESSGRGADVLVAGQSLPSFTSRKVQTTLRLRDGESNMLAGLLREDERKSLRGFPGLLRVPVLRELFTSNDSRIEQSDIVMLLTPRIVRTHEISADDLRSINVGTSQNLSIGGQGPVFGALTTTGTPPTPLDRSIPGAPAGGIPERPVAAGAGVPTGTLVPPVNTVPRPVADLPVTTTTPAANPTTPPVVPMADNAPGRTPVPTEPQLAPAQVIVAAADMTAGTTTSVPISISNASRIRQITLSLSYNPTLMRARAVAEGGFMSQGGQTATFIPRIDEAAGRVDIVILRASDSSGASGTGLLASVQFDPVAPGGGTLSVSGGATTPEGQTLPLQFVPAQFRIR